MTRPPSALSSSLSLPVSGAVVALRKRGSVILEGSSNQGGCMDTTRLTSHSVPVKQVDGVLHYCVPNMPGIEQRTATLALTNATLPFIVRIASAGVEQAIRSDPGLAQGVNLTDGRVTCKGVAEAHGMRFEPLR